MAQSQAKSTRDTYNYGQYINQFPPNKIKAIREYKRIQKKICRQKMFNEICINEEMLPKYTYIHTYIHMARNKFHLKFLEAIYISMNHPSLCRQLKSHTLDIFGELLDTGVT